MALFNWDPLREMKLLRREIDRTLENFDFGRWSFPFSRFSFLPGRSAQAYPLLNMSEDQDNLEVEALAPGIDPQSLKVSVVHDQLTIAGKKNTMAKDVKPEAWHRNERAIGEFVRTINLPREIDANKIKARYENGLLRITMAKAEAAKPKQIAVHMA